MVGMRVSSWRLSCVVVALAGLSALSLAKPARSVAPPRSDAGRLTTGPAPTRATGPTLAVGDGVRTKAGERQRVKLPDGSVLYANESTLARLTEDRQIDLLSGEVFLEVAAQREQAFTVRAPGRQVKATGTRFGVRAGEKSSRVVVASGSVSLEGSAVRIGAGQQVAEGEEKPTAAPRVSHVLGWMRELMSGPTLVPKSAHAGGSITVKTPQGKEAKLSLRKYQVDVHVEDGFARTTIDQVFFNASEERLEGTFRFPLPPDASLSRLAMYVDGKLMEGGMADRDYARNVYERILYQRQDPALLEWVDGSTFKMRVFPLEPRQEKRIVLSYSQRVSNLYGQLSYRFPAGHSLDRVNLWSFQARVKGGAGLAWDSGAHSLTATREKGDLLLKGEVKNARLDRDVVLHLSDASGARAESDSTLFSSHEQEGQKYLLVRYRPGLETKTEAPRRDWVFLVETSADRDRLLATTQIEIVRSLLAQAGPDDTFAVLTAATRTTTLAEGLQPVSVTSGDRAAAFLQNAHVIGALDLGNGLQTAATFLKGAKSPWLVHVGSATPALGTRKHDELIKKIPEGTHYVGVGVGKRWDRAFMKQAAEKTAGFFTQINPDENLTWKTFDLAATLNTPRLLDLSINDPSGKWTFLPFVRAVSQGEEIAAVARASSETKLPAKVSIKGTLEGANFEKELKVEKVAEKAGYLPRTWASLEIERLLAEDAGKNKPEIIALSKAMYVMTPFTSLLVLENDDMYTQFKVDRGRKDHWALYPAPDKIPVVKEPGDGPGKPSRKAVFDTIAHRRGTATVLKLGELSEAWGRMPELLREHRMALRKSASRTSGDNLASGFNPAMFGGGEPGKPLAPVIFQDGTSSTIDFASRLDPQSAPPDKLVRGTRTMGSAVEDSEKQPDLTNTDLGLDDTLTTQYNVDRIEELSVAGQVDPDAIVGKKRVFDASPKGIPASASLPGSGAGTWSGLAWSADGAMLAGSSPARGRAVRLWAEGGEAERLRRKSRFTEALVSSASRLQDDLLYARPVYASNDRLFYDLLSHAPGMNATEADVEAVLESEGRPLEGEVHGKIESGAKALIERARKQGWQRMGFTVEGKVVSVSFDGRGRYAYSRTLAGGMKEAVVCDGTTIHHLYPELGLAARRKVSAFHRLDLARSIPVALPLAEDLARGADLVLSGPRTIALIPHDKRSKVRLEMTFSVEGPLSERRIVEIATKKVLYRETLGEGKVKRLDAEGKVLSTLEIEDASGKEPTLKADVEKLVVVDLPFRTPAQVIKALKLEKKGWRDYTFAEATALLCAYVGVGDAGNARNLFRQSLFDREQRQLGYYVLLASAGVPLDGDNEDVQAEHPDSALAQYLALHSSPALRKHASQWAAGGNVWPEGILKRLALGHALCQRWQLGRALGTTSTQRKAERDRALAYVKKYQGTDLSWALLGLIHDRLRDLESREGLSEEVRSAYKELGSGWKLFQESPGVGDLAKYEEARCLFKAGQGKASRSAFRALYTRLLSEGDLPRIDSDFRSALLEAGKEEEGWNTLLNKAAKSLVEKKHRDGVLLLAQQSWELGDETTAERLREQALDGVGAGLEGLFLRLRAVAFLRRAGNKAEAQTVLAGILGNPEYVGMSSLWRLHNTLARERHQPAEALAYLERALEIEHRSAPEIVDVAKLRSGYGELLSTYAKQAEVLGTLKLEVPAGFGAKVVRAADRWRAHDPEMASCCNQAADILAILGDRDLAWDYLTTPLSQRPGESGPLADLASRLASQGEWRLADRAFESAFAAESSNAQFLWDRAQNLRKAGQTAKARALYRQLIDGDWQPRFADLKRQAASLLEGS